MLEPSNRALTVTRTAKSGPFFYERILRPGWGALLVIALFFVFARFFMTIFLSSVVSYRFPRGQHFHAPIEYAPEFVSLLALFLAIFIVSILEHRKLSAYGFRSNRKLSMLLTGFSIGIVLVSGLIALLAHLQLLVFQGRTLFGLALLKYAAIHLIAFSAVALFEEMGLRGYLQYTLTRGLTYLYRRIFGVAHPMHWAFWTAAVLLSTLFVYIHIHNAGETTSGLISIALLALLAAWSLWRTGSLWWAIGFHLALDFAEAFLYGGAASGFQLRDRLFATYLQGDPLWSGGTDGPEGSLLFLGLIAIAAILVAFLPREPLYPDLLPLTTVPQIDTNPDPDSIRARTR